MRSTRWCRWCWGPTSCAASSACRRRPARPPTVAIRWSSRYNDATGPRALSRERLTHAVAVLDHPDAEQRGLRRPPVHAVIGLLTDLRADAHPQPGARRVLHAGRLFRLLAADPRAQLLADRARRRPRRGIDRR